MLLATTWVITGFAQWFLITMFGIISTLLIWALKRYIEKNDQKHSDALQAITKIATSIDRHVSSQEERNRDNEKSIRVIFRKLDKHDERLDTHGERIASLQTQLKNND